MRFGRCGRGVISNSSWSCIILMTAPCEMDEDGGWTGYRRGWGGMGMGGGGGIGVKK